MLFGVSGLLLLLLLSQIESQIAVPSQVLMSSSTGAWGRHACVIMCVRACVRAVCVCVRVCVSTVCVWGGSERVHPRMCACMRRAGRVCLGVHVCGPECDPTNNE